MKEHKSLHNADVATRWRMQMVLSLVVGCLLLRLAGEVLGYSRPSAGSAVRSATVPPSSYQSGLIETPKPIDNSGNLLVTGNVAGGKYFHGGVPYRATTSISAALGSTTLDSFMRYTEPTDFGSSSQGYSAFYSPTGTVATLQPGPPQTRQVAFDIGPMGPIPNAWGVRVPELQGSAGTQGDAGQLGFSAGARLRSGTLPVGSDEARDTAADGLGELPIDRPEAAGSEQYGQQWQELQHRLGQVQAGAVELERSLTAVHDRSDERLQPLLDYQSQGPQPPADGSLSRRQELLQETATLPSATIELPRDIVQQNNVPAPDAVVALEGETYSGAGLRLYDPQRDSQLTLNMALSVGRAGSQPTRAERFDSDERAGQGPTLGTSAELPALQGVEKTAVGANDYSPLLTPSATSMDRVAALAKRLRTTSGSDNATDPVEKTVVGANDYPPPQSSIDEPTRQKDNKRPAFSQSACESHLQTGQSYLKQGKHLRAAESFALASAYNPNEPRAYLGRCQALFGAGEFLGSALSLAKAIELDPKRALQRADLVWISGGPEAFIARFNDLAKAAQAGARADGDSPLLQFLLAYVYYQMERPQEARAAIDAARKGLPSSLAVEILDTAISR